MEKAGSPAGQMPKDNSPGGAEHQERADRFAERAYGFARTWMQAHQGTAAEFVAALTEKFGFGVRMYIPELTERLAIDPELTRIQRDYIASNLSSGAIREALDGARAPRALWDSGLDGLFARSLEHRSSEKFIEAVDFVARFRAYAPFNNMLVYLQRPTATFWATERDWQERFGRAVKEDSIPIIILRPMGPVMLVYDLADTEGAPVPDYFTEAFTAEGDLDPGRLAMTEENCLRVGIRIKRKSLGMLHAGTAIRSPASAASKMVIEVNQDLPLASQYDTLCHELAHIYLGHLGGDAQGEWPSRLGLRGNQRELEAEAVAYIVCRRVGLRTSSAEYLAGYLENREDLKGISVDMIMKVAGHIERMGKERVPPRRKPNARPKGPEQLTLPTR